MRIAVFGAFASLLAISGRVVDAVELRMPESKIEELAPDHQLSQAQSEADSDVLSKSKGHSLAKTAIKIANKAGLDLSGQVDSIIESASKSLSESKSKSSVEALADAHAESKEVIQTDNAKS